jgi:hypothetical protein
MAATSGGFGRIVWMPTFDAENPVRYSRETRPFVPHLREQLAPFRGAEVITAIAHHSFVLATGHSSPEE